jgi:hypothetical protein
MTRHPRFPALAFSASLSPRRARLFRRLDENTRRKKEKEFRRSKGEKGLFSRVEDKFHSARR